MASKSKGQESPVARVLATRIFCFASLPTDMEHSTVRVDTRGRVLRVPVSHKAFRSYNPLVDAWRCAGTMTADAEDAPAPIVVLDFHVRSAIGSLICVAYIVNEDSCLRIGQLKSHEPDDDVIEQRRTSRVGLRAPRSSQSQ